MNHDKLQEMVFAFHDGELDAAGVKQVEAHLAQCAECRLLVERWKRAAAVFFKTPQAESSEFFVHQVMERIRTSEVRGRVSLKEHVLRWFVVPAAGFAVLILTLAPLRTPFSMDELVIAQDSASVWDGNSLNEDDALAYIMGENA